MDFETFYQVHESNESEYVKFVHMVFEYQDGDKDYAKELRSILSRMHTDFHPDPKQGIYTIDISTVTKI